MALVDLQVQRRGWPTDYCLVFIIVSFIEEAARRLGPVSIPTIPKRIY
jgi:hypothetical protein